MQPDIQSDGAVTYLDGHTSIVKAVAVSPDGRTLVSTGLDGRVIVRDLPGGKLRHVSTVTVNDSSKPAPLFSLAISPDNTYALAGGNPNQAGTLKVRLDRQHFEPIGLPSNGSVKATMFYDEGRKLVYRAGDSELVCYDLVANHVITSTPIYPGQFFGNVRASAACPDGRFVAVTSSNMKPDPGGGATSADPCKLTVFDTAGVERLSWQFADYADFSFAQIAFAGPQTLVVCLPSGQMLRWTLDANDQWQPDADSIRIAPGRFTASAVSRDGTVICLAENRQIVGISASTGEAVAWIDLKIGERREAYASFPIESIAVTSDPLVIAAALWDGRVASARCWPMKESNTDKAAAQAEAPSKEPISANVPLAR
jgi:hypothetical protein